MVESQKHLLSLQVLVLQILLSIVQLVALGIQVQITLLVISLLTHRMEIRFIGILLRVQLPVLTLEYLSVLLVQMDKFLEIGQIHSVLMQEMEKTVLMVKMDKMVEMVLTAQI